MNKLSYCDDKIFLKISESEKTNSLDISTLLTLRFFYGATMIKPEAKVGLKK